MLRYTDQEFIEIFNESKTISEMLKKVGLQHAGANYRTIHNECKRLNLSVDKFKGFSKNKPSLNSNRGKDLSKTGRKIPLEYILKENISYSTFNLKNRLIEENIFERKCYKCDLTKWNNQPIALELEHKNGDHFDNRLENLTILCPNCHAQTPTYRGKNKAYRTTNTTAINPSSIFYQDKILNEGTNKLQDIVKFDIDIIKKELENKTVIDVANIFGATESQLYVFMRENNIKSPSKSRFYLRFNPTKEELEKLIQEKSMVELR